MSTADRIRSFATLQQGWHYGTGGPISADVIERAVAWDARLREWGYEATEGFASEARSVLVCGYRGEDVLEILVEPGGLCDVADDRAGKPDDDDRYYEGLDEEAAIVMARTIAAETIALPEEVENVGPLLERVDAALGRDV